MLGNGDGTLQMPAPFTTARIPRSVVVGDFDGNGELDMAVATLVGNAVTCCSGTATAHSRRGRITQRERRRMRLCKATSMATGESTWRFQT